MSTTVGPRVEIDDRIREQPELFRVVQLSTEFLEELAGASSHNLDIEWRSVAHDDRLIELGLSEHRDFQAGIRTTFAATNLFDPVNRKLRLLKAWDYILRARSNRNMERIAELINQLQRESDDVGEDAHPVAGADPGTAGRTHPPDREG